MLLDKMKEKYCQILKDWRNTFDIMIKCNNDFDFLESCDLTQTVRIAKLRCIEDIIKASGYSFEDFRKECEIKINE